MELKVRYTLYSIPPYLYIGSVLRTFSAQLFLWFSYSLMYLHVQPDCVGTLNSLCCYSYLQAVYRFSLASWDQLFLLQRHPNCKFCIFGMFWVFLSHLSFKICSSMFLCSLCVSTLVLLLTDWSIGVASTLRSPFAHGFVPAPPPCPPFLIHFSLYCITYLVSDLCR